MNFFIYVFVVKHHSSAEFRYTKIKWKLNFGHEDHLIFYTLPFTNYYSAKKYKWTTLIITKETNVRITHNLWYTYLFQYWLDPDFFGYPYSA